MTKPITIDSLMELDACRYGLLRFRTHFGEEGVVPTHDAITGWITEEGFEELFWYVARLDPAFRWRAIEIAYADLKRTFPQLETIELTPAISDDLLLFVRQPLRDLGAAVAEFRKEPAHFAGFPIYYAFMAVGGAETEAGEQIVTQAIELIMRHAQEES